MSEEETGEELEEFYEKSSDAIGESLDVKTEEQHAYSAAEQSSEQETSSIGEQELQAQEHSISQPALVINVQSWATPVAGLLMLVIGLLVGYLIHPLIPTPAQVETPAAAAAAAVAANTPVSETAPTAENSAAAVAATQAPANLEEVMSYLMSQARHIKGDPQAPVTMIEFSDFQ